MVCASISKRAAESPGKVALGRAGVGLSELQKKVDADQRCQARACAVRVTITWWSKERDGTSCSDGGQMFKHGPGKTRNSPAGRHRSIDTFPDLLPPSGPGVVPRSLRRSSCPSLSTGSRCPHGTDEPMLNIALNTLSTPVESAWNDGRANSWECAGFSRVAETSRKVSRCGIVPYHSLLVSY